VPVFAALIASAAPGIAAHDPGRSWGAGAPEGAPPAVAHAAGAKRTDPRGVEQVWVPPGSFRMGTDDAAMKAIQALSPPGWVAKELPSEQPAHDVRLTSGYWIDRTEVTNASFATFASAGGYRDRALWSDAGWSWLQGRDPAALPLPATGGPSHPRVRVTWFEAEAYARWRGGRLPTEAEWEFAARGPKSRIYPWGEKFDPARCVVVGAASSEPVGSRPKGASWVGAQDMAGNAMEWVHDWLDTVYYRASPASGPPGPDTGRVKVEKGGWWGSNPFVARAAYRHYEDPPDYGDQHIGFRVVADERAPGERAAAIAAAVERIASGTPLWPGFTPLSIPLAVYDGEKTWLFRHPSPPEGFVPVEGMRPPALAMPGRQPDVTANSSATIGGVVTATVIADGTTAGRTPDQLAALTLHEQFHVFQRTHHPSWAGNEGDLFLYPVDRADLLAWRRLESRALAQALTAPTKEEGACWAGRAMDWRTRRFGAMEAPFVAYERAMELNEGLASYIQARAAGKTTVTIPEKEFADDDVRQRTYVVGPAIALLLDRLSPEWKTALEADDRLFLDDLLRAVAANGAAGAQVAACEETPADTGAAESAARDDVAALVKARQDRRRAFDALSGWRVVVTAADGQPLQSGGFDPLNIEKVEGGLLHTRYLELRNDAGRIQLLREGDAEIDAFTESASGHPLFGGVSRVTVAGLAKPEIVREGSAVTVRAPGLEARFTGATVTIDRTTVSLRLPAAR
jgi:formylglycine-generating enzyme required for sulfatase activity